MSGCFNGTFDLHLEGRNAQLYVLAKLLKDASYLNLEQAQKTCHAVQ